MPPRSTQVCPEANVSDAQSSSGEEAARPSPVLVSGDQLSSFLTAFTKAQPEANRQLVETLIIHNGKFLAQRKFAQGAFVPPGAKVVNSNADKRVDTTSENTKEEKKRSVIHHNTSAKKLLDKIAFDGIHKHTPVVILKRLQEQPSVEFDEGEIDMGMNVKNSVDLPEPNTPIISRTPLIRNIPSPNTLCLRSRIVIGTSTGTGKRTKKTISKRAPPRDQISRIEGKQADLRKFTKKLRSKQNSMDTDFSVEDEQPLKLLSKSMTKKKRKSRKLMKQKPSMRSSRGSQMERASSPLSMTSVHNDTPLIFLRKKHRKSDGRIIVPSVPQQIAVLTAEDNSQLRETSSTNVTSCDVINEEEAAAAVSTLFTNLCPSPSRPERFQSTQINELHSIRIRTNLIDMTPVSNEPGPSGLNIIASDDNIMRRIPIEAAPRGRAKRGHTRAPRSKIRLTHTREHVTQASASRGRGRSYLTRSQAHHEQVLQAQPLAPTESEHNMSSNQSIPTVELPSLPAPEPVNYETQRLAQAGNESSHNASDAHRPRDGPHDHEEVFRASTDRDYLQHDSDLLDGKPMDTDFSSHVKYEGQIESTSSRSSTDTDLNAENATTSTTEDKAKIVTAKIFRPTTKEFEDPVAYFEKILPLAAPYGICKVIPPDGFKPSCIMSESVRFKVSNQYVPRFCNRWGQATRQACAMRLLLARQNKNTLQNAPTLEGLEVDLNKILTFVHREGGAKKLHDSQGDIDVNKWHALSEEMNYANLGNCTKKIDYIYLKYIMPYDALTQSGRQKILDLLDTKWHIRYKKMLRRAKAPLIRQQKLLGECESSEEDECQEDFHVTMLLEEAEDCVIRGKFMTISHFKKIADNAMSVNFPSKPTLDEVESKYWKLISLGDEHLCVYSAFIDTGSAGIGFSKNPQDPNYKHPWNLKRLSENKNNVLRSLRNVIGVTIPMLHAGMVYSTSCWHRDPHGLPWIEYMHSGPEKIWYGIPDEKSKKFRRAVEKITPIACQNKEIWLPSDVIMIPPSMLLNEGVSLSRLVQGPGEFVITLPRAYSSSICTGYTISESVYFALNSWISTINQVFHMLRSNCEPTMFALEQLLIAVAYDPDASDAMLQVAHTGLSTIIAEELENRTVLETLGLVPVNLKIQTTHMPSGQWNECEVCRCSLFLSRMKGIFRKGFSVCLRHAVQILENKSKKPVTRDIASCEMVYFFNNEQLQNIMQIIRDRITKITEENIYVQSEENG